MPTSGLSKNATLTGHRETLRSESIKVRPIQAREVFAIDARWRPIHYTANNFQANADGTVSNKTTGLIWQESGSDYPVTWHEAHCYIQELNQKRFAGRTDWRFSTVNELMSLLTKVQKKRTYEELEKRGRELEKEGAERKYNEEALRNTNELLEKVFSTTHMLIAYMHERTN